MQDNTIVVRFPCFSEILALLKNSSNCPVGIPAVDDDGIEADNNNEGRQGHSEQTTNARRPEDEAFMRRVMAYVEENIGNSDANVSEMAAEAAVSETSLYRKMHSLLGVSPGSFMQEARLVRASELLKETSSVSDVAYACGFENPKYFSKCFKKRFGLSPSDYRTSV